MSDLNPKGTMINVNGEERRLLFTLNAIDQIQSDMEEPVFDVLRRLGEDSTFSDTLRYLIAVLLADEADRVKALEGRDLRKYTEKELGWIITNDNLDYFVEAILAAYGVSNPEPDGDSDPNLQSGSMKK